MFVICAYNLKSGNFIIFSLQVRNENFLEIVAFVVQNFGYIVYSFVQGT